MPKPRNVAFVKSVSNVFSESSAFVVVRASGISAARLTQLRFSLHKVSAKMLVTKNRLVSVALRDDNRFDAMVAMMKGPTFVAHSNDIVLLSQAVCNFVNDKTVDGAKILCGVFGSKSLSEKDVVRMSTMPSAEEMRGSIISAVSYGTRSLVFNLQSGPLMLVHLLNSYVEQLKC